ncbi:MAG: glycosyltransferase family 2 protein [Acidobacteriota bacterium]|nr:glycosyltransferase family 2 protein [Acidobacteriota bacterium]
MVTPASISAVVVDYRAGEALAHCVASLRANGVTEIIVVDNAESPESERVLGADVATVVETGVNLGYGRGVNRGAALAAGEYLVVSNPDIVVHDGAVAALVEYLAAHLEVGIVAPRIERPDASVYPSQRVFPNVALAGAHALLAPLWPDNPATRRYRAARADGTVEWVSGAFFVMRRADFEAVGGFDERFFMFAEDMDLCWRVRERGLEIAAVNDAVVTHAEGLSRRHASRAMLAAHHVSALRFEAYHARGWRRLLVPVAAAVLGVRLVVALITTGAGTQSE